MGVVGGRIGRPDQRQALPVGVWGGSSLADAYAGADIVLDFAGVKNGGTAFYRNAGVTYASAAAAGFTGTGTFNASGFNVTGTQKITGNVTFPQNYIILVEFATPDFLTNQAAYFENGTNVSVQALTDTNVYFRSTAVSGATRTKIVGGFNVNQKISVDGGAVVTGGAAPAAIGATTLHVGNRFDGAQPFNVAIKRLQIYLSALTDAQIVALGV